MGKEDAAYQQGYDRGFQRGRQVSKEDIERAQIVFAQNLTRLDLITLKNAFSCAMAAFIGINHQEKPEAKCRHCDKPIYLQNDGVWYHTETTSIYCVDHPYLCGFTRDYRAVPKVMTCRDQDWVADPLNDYSKARQAWHRGDYTLNRWPGREVGTNWTITYWDGKNRNEISMNKTISIDLNVLANLLEAKGWADGVIYRHNQGFRHKQGG